MNNVHIIIASLALSALLSAVRRLNLFSSCLRGFLSDFRRVYQQNWMTVTWQRVCNPFRYAAHCTHTHTPMGHGTDSTLLKIFAAKIDAHTFRWSVYLRELPFAHGLWSTRRINSPKRNGTYNILQTGKFFGIRHRTRLHVYKHCGFALVVLFNALNWNDSSSLLVDGSLAECNIFDLSACLSVFGQEIYSLSVFDRGLCVFVCECHISTTISTL